MNWLQPVKWIGKIGDVVVHVNSTRAVLRATIPNQSDFTFSINGHPDFTRPRLEEMAAALNRFVHLAKAASTGAEQPSGPIAALEDGRSE